MTCIDGKRVHSNKALRSSWIYSGGPNGVEKKPYLVIADCDRKVMTLQDKSGVNFGGGTFKATPVSASLSQWLCEATKTIPDKSLKQF